MNPQNSWERRSFCNQGGSPLPESRNKSIRAVRQAVVFRLINRCPLRVHVSTNLVLPPMSSLALSSPWLPSRRCPCRRRTNHLGRSLSFLALQKFRIPRPHFLVRLLFHLLVVGLTYLPFHGRCRGVLSRAFVNERAPHLRGTRGGLCARTILLQRQPRSATIPLLPSRARRLSLDCSRFPIRSSEPLRRSFAPQPRSFRTV